MTLKEVNMQKKLIKSVESFLVHQKIQIFTLIKYQEEILLTFLQNPFSMVQIAILLHI